MTLSKEKRGVSADHEYDAKADYRTWGPAGAQRSGSGGERKKEWSGRSPRRQAGTEQSGISSDESQEALEAHYPRGERAQSEHHYRKAYQDIRRFMEKQGFMWRQNSVYVSEAPMTTMDIVLLSQRMAENLPWLRLCVKEITATDIGAQYIPGPPPQPSGAVAVGRGGRNGAGRVLAARRGRRRAEFLPTRGCCVPTSRPPSFCRPSRRNVLFRQKKHSQGRSR